MALLTKHEKLERIETQLFHLGEAIDNLSNVDHCEDIADMLHDRVIVLAFAKEQLHASIEADDARDREALRREYERDLL